MVIGLVGRGDLARKLAASDAGVDDILVVPFAPEELLARALALLRRSRSAPTVLIPAITVGWRLRPTTDSARACIHSKVLFVGSRSIDLIHLFGAIENGTLSGARP